MENKSNEIKNSEIAENKDDFRNGYNVSNRKNHNRSMEDDSVNRDGYRDKENIRGGNSGNNDRDSCRPREHRINDSPRSTHSRHSNSNSNSNSNYNSSRYNSRNYRERNYDRNYSDRDRNRDRDRDRNRFDNENDSRNRNGNGNRNENKDRNRNGNNNDSNERSRSPKNKNNNNNNSRIASSPNNCEIANPASVDCYKDKDKDKNKENENENKNWHENLNLNSNDDANIEHGYGCEGMRRASESFEREGRENKNDSSEQLEEYSLFEMSQIDFVDKYKVEQCPIIANYSGIGPIPKCPNEKFCIFWHYTNNYKLENSTNGNKQRNDASKWADEIDGGFTNNTDIGNIDRRRDLTKFTYDFYPCPKLFSQILNNVQKRRQTRKKNCSNKENKENISVDANDNENDNDNCNLIEKYQLSICEAGDLCKHSHSFTEMWFHPRIYKVKPCPYLKIGCQKCPWISFDNEKNLKQFSKKEEKYSNQIDNVNIVVYPNREKEKNKNKNKNKKEDNQEIDKLRVECIDACAHFHDYRNDKNGHVTIPYNCRLQPNEEKKRARIGYRSLADFLDRNRAKYWPQK